MRRLSDKGVEDLENLKRRVHRAAGLGHIRSEEVSELVNQISTLQQHFRTAEQRAGRIVDIGNRA